jgi:Flp pilus assembly protein TadG
VEDRRVVNHSRRARGRGQSLVEFALVAPILLLLVGGAVQYAAVMATKHSLTQIARDTARWASTQTTYSPCTNAATASPAQPLTRADELAVGASLPGYTSGDWHGPTNNPAGNFVSGTTALPAAAPFTEGIEVAWTGAACPTADITTKAFVTVRITHRIPIFLPGAWFIPGLCNDSGCNLSLSATSIFRMEPPPE